MEISRFFITRGDKLMTKIAGRPARSLRVTGGGGGGGEETADISD